MTDQARDNRFLNLIYARPDVEIGIVAFGCQRDGNSELKLVDKKYLVSEHNPSSPCGGIVISNSDLTGKYRKSLSIDHSKLDAKVQEIVFGIHVIDETGTTCFSEIPGLYAELMDGTWQLEYFTLDRTYPKYQAMILCVLYFNPQHHFWETQFFVGNDRLELSEIHSLEAYYSRIDLSFR